MKFRLKLPFYFLALSLASCNFAKFDRYPGEKLNEIPAEFQGDFISIEKKKNEPSDTLYVSVKKDNIALNDGNGSKNSVINKDFVLSKIEDQYFISGKDEEQDTYFSIIYGIKPLKKNKGVEMIPILVSGITDEDKLSDYLKYDTLVKPTYNTIYQEKDTVMELKNDAVLLFKMDDAKFLKFYKKKISRKDGIILRRREN